MLTALLILPVAALSAPSASARPASPRHHPMVSTLTNSDPRGNQVVRFDTVGNAIDAHDGGIVRFGHTYYLYGTSYGCGFVWQQTGSRWCGFKVYSSPDLVHWTDRGYTFNAATSYWQQHCTYNGCFRPHVIYNRATRKYVLWFNLASPSGYMAMTSASPAGPFTGPSAPTLAVEGSNGDENLFVDSDGTGYVVYTAANQGYDLIVERLNGSYTSGTGSYARLHTSFVEAPAMFERHGLYYVTFSDPACPYCTATGTAYLTARSPLGPWQGRPVWTASNRQLRVGGSYYTSATGIGLSKAGAGWTDYTISFDTAPQIGAVFGTVYAYSGWVFRSPDPQNGYAWALSNYPYTSPSAPGYLVKSIYKNGNLVFQQPVPLNFPVTAGHWYKVATTVSGATITTQVNGQVVDRTIDATFGQGRVGFQATGSTSALVDNVTVTAPGGSTLLSDDFSDGLSQWDPLVGPPVITPTSCGGQPAQVTEIPTTGGPAYLLQVDLWNQVYDIDRNEALANLYWAPLGFSRDGAIKRLGCENSVSLHLAGGAHGGTNTPLPGLDQTSGQQDFRISRAGTDACDIAGSTERLQTFTPSRTGRLTSVTVTTFKQGVPDHGSPPDTYPGPVPDAPLTVAVVRVAGTELTTLASQTVPETAIGWSARNVTVPVSVPVTRGLTYGFVVSSAATQGCYGWAYSDLNPYPRGQELVSTDGGRTWTGDAAGQRDLKFETVLGHATP
jgi:hypothetical protein